KNSGGIIMLTGTEAKYLLEAVIEKTEKSIEKEKNYQRELTDDRSTLVQIQNLQDNGEILPSDCGYDSYTEWAEEIEKEIKTGENSIRRIEVEKAELMAFKYFVENAPEV
ncbi:MAG: hypothetical protein ACRC0F_10330, partial [Cetobacterium sp.]